MGQDPSRPSDFRFDLQMFAEDDESVELPEDDDEDDEEDINLAEFELSGDEGEEKKDGEEDPKLEAAKAKVRADALEGELKRERDERAAERDRQREDAAALRSERPTPEAYKPPSLEDIVPDDFETQFVTDSKSAMRNLTKRIVETVQEVTRASGSGAGATLVDTQAENFLRSKRDEDPENFALAQKHFRKMIAETSPQLKNNLVNDPGQLAKALEAGWEQALGKAVIENRKNTRTDSQRRESPPPPPMGGTSRSGGGTGSLKGTGRFTKVERDMIEMGKNAGLNAADIKEIISDHRREQKALGA